MTRKTTRRFHCTIDLVLDQSENGKFLVRYIFNDRSGKNLPQLAPGDSPHEVTTEALELMQTLVKDHLAQWVFKAYEDLAGVNTLVER